MQTPISAQAEYHLTQVAARFDHWRQTRTTPAEPIPPALWEQAITLTALVPITRVARRLHVSGGELKKRCAAHHEALAAPTALPPTLEAPASAAAVGFVEVPAVSSWPLSMAAMEIELHRPDGARLRIAAPEGQLPLTALVRTFLEPSA